MTNAMVFPLPVTASAATSFLDRKRGMAAACTGVAVACWRRLRVCRVEGSRAQGREDQEERDMMKVCIRKVLSVPLAQSLCVNASRFAVFTLSYSFVYVFAAFTVRRQIQI